MPDTTILRYIESGKPIAFSIINFEDGTRHKATVDLDQGDLLSIEVEGFQRIVLIVDGDHLKVLRDCEVDLETVLSLPKRNTES